MAAKMLLTGMAWLCELIGVYCPWFWPHFDQFLLFCSEAWRLFSGRFAAEGLEMCARPKEKLQLFEFEGCPSCRLVRETMSVLDLDYICYPCPRETLGAAGVCLNSRFRPQVKREGGKLQFPFLVDPNRSVKMYESKEIVDYLWNTYGNEAKAPRNYRIVNHPSLQYLTLRMSMLCRPCMHMGILRAPSRKPEKPLELWGSEGSPFSRRVKECLSTCELPYIHFVLPFGSNEKRARFAKEHESELSATRKKMGIVKTPYLRDPNTGASLFESRDIVAYLETKYQTAPVPNESWQDYNSRTTVSVTQ